MQEFIIEVPDEVSPPQIKDLLEGVFKCECGVYKRSVPTSDLFILKWLSARAGCPGIVDAKNYLHELINIMKQHPRYVYNRKGRLKYNDE